jgi:bilirubin oxidase
MFNNGIVYTAAAGLLFLLPSILADGDTSLANRRSPAYPFTFKVPLTIPQMKAPITSYTNPETGVPIDFYQVEVKNVAHRIYPNLGEANLITFDGTVPGPTFRVQKGRESVIRVINKANREVNFHVHGSYSKSLLADIITSPLTKTFDS